MVWSIQNKLFFGTFLIDNYNTTFNFVKKKQLFDYIKFISKYGLQ